MIIGRGINSADAGEIWHMFDPQFRIPKTWQHLQQYPQQH